MSSKGKVSINIDSVAAYNEASDWRTSCQTSRANGENMIPHLLRYPGGKGRILSALKFFLPAEKEIYWRYIDPFIGGASVFFYLQPQNALLSDSNPDLIDLYSTLKEYPCEIWEQYQQIPAGKESYYNIRSIDPSKLGRPMRAARLLYLNRTCFKGMWRHNNKGQFNVGYGGESRRWVISNPELMEASRRLHSADIRCSDFEPIVAEATKADFLFIDPPYRPGYSEMRNAHYTGRQFTYSDQFRLAAALRQATGRGVPWVMTNSSHPDILRLYQGYYVATMRVGTGAHPGLLSVGGEEAVIFNRPAAHLDLVVPLGVSTL